MSKLVLGRYDIAACMTFAVYAMCSLIIPMCLVPLAADLHFPLDAGGMGLGGALQVGRAIPMVAAMVLCGFAAGRWGKRRSLGVSILFMCLGIMSCAFAPAYGVVIAALVVSGLGEGVIEGLATPYIQDLHPNDSGRYLNFSHSFWSVGVVAIVLVAGALLSLGVSWRLLVFGCGLASVVPVLLYLLPGRDGVKEHDEPAHWKEICSKTRDIVGEKRFWLFFVAMFFAGGGEFCLTFWCASFIQLEYGGSPWVAGAGTACFAAGMFLGRLFSGFWVPQNRLKALVVWTAAAATVVCVFFPWLQSVGTLLALL
ncbi:MAG: MFS transporter, partial [Planctomycetota bacterium]|nr:MFS transporter [Planctomycetota bacterium]